MKFTDSHHMAGSGPLHLFAVTEDATEVKPTEGHFPFPLKVNGLDAHYYWRDSVIPGHYAHPTDKWELDIAVDDLPRFASTFGKMRDNGVPVPIVADHDESAKSTLGYIVDAKLEGGRLHLLQQYLGDAARDIGLRNHVSVGIDPNIKDGHGREYGPGIRHSAATPRPVMPGQGEHIRAASLVGDPSAPAAPDSHTPPTDPAPPGEETTDMAQWNMTEETEDGCHKAVPGLDKSHANDKAARMLQHVQTQDAHLDKMRKWAAGVGGVDDAGLKTMSLDDLTTKATTAQADLKRKGDAAQAEADRMKAENERLAGEVKTFSMNAKAAADASPTVREKAGHARHADAVWKTVSAIDTATVNVVRGLLRDPDKSPALFAMSMRPTPAGDAEFEFALADALANAKPSVGPNGPATGPQVLEPTNVGKPATADDKEAFRLLSLSAGIKRTS